MVGILNAVFVGILFIINSSMAYDPFEPTPDELLIRSGPLAGQTLSAERRPVIAISPEQHSALGLPDLGPNYLWVANFFEQKKFMPDRQSFHIAAIPLEGINRAIKEVVDRSKYNPPETGKLLNKIRVVGPHFHAQMMIEFDKDILLFSQEADEKSGKLKTPESIHKINSVTFTVGAARPDKANFDQNAAMGNSYRRISLLVGENEAHRELIIGENINRFEVKIPKFQLGEFLKLATQESTKDKLHHPYNAMSDGCLSVTLGYLDKILFASPPARFPLSWPNSPEAVMGEYKARGLEYVAIEPVVSDASPRARERFDPGPYNKNKIHPYTHVGRFVGNCASILSQLTTKASLLLKTD